MRKFAFLAVLAATLCCAPAWAETYLWSRHHSIARLVDGKSVYDGAEFYGVLLSVQDDDREATQAYLDAEGSLTIYEGSYTFWNGTADEAVNGIDKTFPLKADMEIGYTLDYMPVNASGKAFNFFRGAADTGLNGKPVIWEFPTQPELNGRTTVPNFRSTAQQLATYVPYVELVRSGGNITGIRYRMVVPSDTVSALSMPHASSVEVSLWNDARLFRSDWRRFDANERQEDIVTLSTSIAEADVRYVHVRFWDGDILYSWSFVISETDKDEKDTGGGGGGCDTHAGASALTGGLAFLFAIPLLRRRRG